MFMNHFCDCNWIYFKLYNNSFQNIGFLQRPFKVFHPGFKHDQGESVVNSSHLGVNISARDFHHIQQTIRSGRVVWKMSAQVVAQFLTGLQNQEEFINDWDWY